jgi:16S rRNA (adenine1518-N6/adenine1519-N6)-dimethyltransferase
LGQNFLIDGNIVKKSLVLGGVQSGDRIVEIGPGLGTLTGALIAAGAEVFAIELDRKLAQHVRDSLVPQSDGRLHLVEGDGVKIPLAGLEDAAERPFKVVANLPYAISSPWMEAIVAGPLPERMVLMLQLEAAQRYAAQVGTKSFGAISVFLQAAFDRAPSHKVNRSCFYPQPDVGSILAVYKKKADSYQFSKQGRNLIRVFFQHRRKQLVPMVRRECPDIAEQWIAHVAESGLPETTRAENVPVNLWVKLDRLLEE